MVLLHVLLAFRWPFDPDEWQHLHVAWAWSQGMVAYRDFFDNHMPLFHLLTAPLVALCGETVHILSLMRLAMIPLTLATLACSAVIGLRLWGPRAALWTPVLLAPVSVFFFRSIEYRADSLWALLCTGAMAVIVSGPAGPARALAAGVLLGLAIVTSLKTVLLIFALGVALLLLPLAAGPGQAAASRRSWIRLLPPLMGGTLGPLLLLSLLFARLGAGRALLNATVTHNLLGGLGTWSVPWRRLLFLPEMALVTGAAAWLARRRGPSPVARRVAFLVLAAGAFFAALQTIWPLYTTYDLLVFYPLLAPIIVGSMQAPGGAAPVPEPGGRPAQAWRYPAIVLLLLAYMALDYAQTDRTSFGREGQEAFLSEVLRLTDAGDPVLDQKGDSIFRRRPTYYIMEKLTVDRLERGLIPEHIQEDLVASRTCVAAGRMSLFPARTRAFLKENFLPVGHLLIAGRFLDVQGTEKIHEGEFNIAIPARYALVSESGEIEGLLDGRPYDGPRELAPGRHSFRLTCRGPRAAVIWAKAAERGFLPFEAGEAHPVEETPPAPRPEGSAPEGIRR